MRDKDTLPETAPRSKGLTLLKWGGISLIISFILVGAMPQDSTTPAVFAVLSSLAIIVGIVLYIFELLNLAATKASEILKFKNTRPQIKSSLEKPSHDFILSDDELYETTLNEDPRYQSHTYTAPPSKQNNSGNEMSRFWLPKGKETKIAGITLTNGMIYVGGKLKKPNSYRESDNCLINPRLKVAESNSPYYDEDMPYWPSYSDITPQNRRHYLYWLASGAQHPDVPIGYVFLYFYGLERQLLHERSEADRDDIITEIKRLLSLYGDNHSIERYCKTALSYAEVFLQTNQATPSVGLSKSYGWEMPLDVRVYLGKKLKENTLLTIEDTLIWFFNHPEIHLRTPAQRLEDEFIALMRIQLTRQYPDGLKVRMPKRKLSAIYEASSNNFNVDFSDTLGELPDISTINSPIKKMNAIADEAMDALDKLSRLIGRTPEAKGTLKAYALLPPELAGTCGGEVIEDIKTWLNQTHENNEELTFSDVIKKTTEHNGQKVTQTIHKEIQKITSLLGWNMTPSFNEVLGSAKPDMKLILQPSNVTAPAIENPSTNFQIALLELTLGAHLAHADGRVIAEEIELLKQRIEKLENIKPDEKNRLNLYLQWLSIQPTDLNTLKRKLKDLNADAKEVLANVAIEVVAADGRITPEEVRALEVIYKAMGLDKKDLFSNLHSISQSNPSTHAANSDIASSEDGEIELDMTRIAAISRDTAKASTLLASIFEEEDEDEITPEPVIEEETPSRYSGLDIKHAQLLQELLAKPQWPREEYEQLVSNLNLMPDGAIETINEWAFENLDDAIIEDDDPMSIYSELLNERAA